MVCPSVPGLCGSLGVSQVDRIVGETAEQGIDRLVRESTLGYVIDEALDENSRIVAWWQTP